MIDPLRHGGQVAELRAAVVFVEAAISELDATAYEEARAVGGGQSPRAREVGAQRTRAVREAAVRAAMRAVAQARVDTFDAVAEIADFETEPGMVRIAWDWWDKLHYEAEAVLPLLEGG